MNTTHTPDPEVRAHFPEKHHAGTSLFTQAINEMTWGFRPLSYADISAAHRKTVSKLESDRAELLAALRIAVVADPSQAVGNGHLAPAAALLRELGVDV
jgi:hypothetical protein